jgi:hypothetical protein
MVRVVLISDDLAVAQTEREQHVLTRPNLASQPLTWASRFLLPLVKIAGHCMMRPATNGNLIHALAAGGCCWHGFWCSACLGQG